MNYEQCTVECVCDGKGVGLCDGRYGPGEQVRSEDVKLSVCCGAPTSLMAGAPCSGLVKGLRSTASPSARVRNLDMMGCRHVCRLQGGTRRDAQRRVSLGLQCSPACYESGPVSCSSQPAQNAQRVQKAPQRWHTVQSGPWVCREIMSLGLYGGAPAAF